MKKKECAKRLVVAVASVVAVSMLYGCGAGVNHNREVSEHEEKQSAQQTTVNDEIENSSYEVKGDTLYIHEDVSPMKRYL